MACWPCPGWAASYICCCQPRGSHRFGQPICGSLATHAASRVDRYALRCAPGAESKSGWALRGPRWAIKREEPSPQRSKETCRLRTDLDASGFDRLPGLLLASALLPQNLPQCSHLCHATRCDSIESPLCRITSKPAEKSAPQRSFCSNRAALQFFCNARRWPPKRRP